MDHFEWNAFAFIYSASEDEQKCPIFLTDIQKAVFNNSVYTLSNTVAMRNVSTSEVTDALKQTSARARIIIVCLTDSAHKRLFMLTAADQGMLNDEYVYIFADLHATGYTIGSSANHTVFVWEDQSDTPDGRDSDAHEAFMRTFMLTDMSDDSDPGSSVDNFTALVSQKMTESPIKCTQCTEEKGWKILCSHGKIAVQDSGRELGKFSADERCQLRLYTGMPTS
ncbi:hypothetical protein ANCCEY_11163 [Ancylostoma ceylanicum]|uniref:Receptor ligand binding region domain-containing protein n=1 Tax=Ancylostoma ceylanicum TaxID=53326 RepID=A0A0D6LCC4_9BILA|nr:hypothetical protein ANCCEY_11163 [Ancylostoma ceylanicum]